MSSIEKRKKSRVKRPPQEVVERLEEQTGFLVSSCRTFDEGNYAEAKRLSVHLRILLHTGRAPVVSLLSQLGAAFKWNRFWSAMIPHNPHGLLSYHGLIVTKMGGSDIKYLPSLDGLADQFLQQHHLALLHGPEQIADLPVPVAESPGAVRIGHPERSHLVEYLAPNSVFNSLPRQRSSPHLRPDERLVTIDRVLHHASRGVA